MDDFISRTSWMRNTSDHTRVTALGIPGTHDCGVDGLFGFGKTQNLDLTDQLSREYDLSTSGLRTIGIISTFTTISYTWANATQTF
jgi:hypothetical protein